MTASCGFFTIASKNYMASVRVLMSSLRRLYPDAPLFLVLCDRVDGRFDPSREGFTIIPAAELGIERFHRFAFKYPILEFNTAVKAAAFRFLFRRGGLERLIYLDPDILVYRPLTEALEALEDAPILLTPHQANLLEHDGNTWVERRILRGGVYNLGFLGLRNGDETAALLEWWNRSLATGCLARTEMGLFVDQKWMDMAPALFAGTRTLRHLGYNVAHWNLSHRPLSGEPASGYRAGGQPLVFFHFSGYSPLQPERLTSAVGDFGFDAKDPVLGALLADYRMKLEAAGHQETLRWPYAYGHFSDGTPIPRRWREAVLRQLEAVADIQNPFDLQATPGLKGRLRRASRNLAPFPDDRWHYNYWRLASTFPLNALLWLRRRVLGVADPEEM